MVWNVWIQQQLLPLKSVLYVKVHPYECCMNHVPGRVNSFGPCRIWDVSSVTSGKRSSLPELFVIRMHVDFQTLWWIVVILTGSVCVYQTLEVSRVLKSYWSRLIKADASGSNEQSGQIYTVWYFVVTSYTLALLLIVFWVVFFLLSSRCFEALMSVCGGMWVHCDTPSSDDEHKELSITATIWWPWLR